MSAASCSAIPARDGSVLRYDVAASEVRGRDALEAGRADCARSITAGGDDWAVVDAEDGEVWLRGADAATRVDATGGVVVGAPDPAGDAVYLATETALISVSLDGAAVKNEYGTGSTVIGAPARPIVHDGEVFAALAAAGRRRRACCGARAAARRRSTTAAGPSATSGDLSSSRATRPSSSTRPAAAGCGPCRTRDLVASSQDWSLDDRTNPDAEPSDEQLTIMIDPKPPVAEPDAFGVRAGSLVTLPVLLNDHDPNEDVLSIDPDLGDGARSRLRRRRRSPTTGSVWPCASRPTRRAQPRSPTPSPTAPAPAGCSPPPTTVTIEVAPDARESAPAWCGVDGCLVPWPEPEVAPGGTVTVPVLPGWVDPEGDPLLLLSVENPSGRGSVAATPSGDVVFQHADDGSGAEELIELAVTVSDTRGATTTKPLLVRVSPEPKLHVQPFAVVDTIDAGLTVDVAPHVTGTAGALALESVRVLDGAAATATVVGGNDRASTSRRRAPAPSASDSPSPTGSAMPTAPPASRSSRRMRRPSSPRRPSSRSCIPSRMRRSTSSRRCRIRRAGCCCSATSSCTPTTGHPSRSTPSDRTTCAYRARPPRAPRDAWEPCRTP